MIELERAQKLCQAIDDLLDGRHRADLEDIELQQLLMLAKLRQDAAACYVRAGKDREAEVLQRVLSSLDFEEDRETRKHIRLVDAGDTLPLERDPVKEKPVSVAPAPLAWAGLSRLPGLLTRRSLSLASGPIVLAAIVIAALDPAPDNGLAGEIAQLMGLAHGVSESQAPPQVPASFKVIEGREVSTSEAAGLLHLPVTEPAYLPEGFAKLSSKYFPFPEEDSGGFFLLAYGPVPAASPSAKILIRQQAAEGGDLAVLQGSASHIILSDGTPATYVRGSWEALGDTLSWGDFQTQSIIFDRGEVRATLRYSGPPIDAAVLARVAGSMLGD